MCALYCPVFPSAAVAELGSSFPQVQSILASRCFSCHGPDVAEGGLALHKPASAHAEAESGRYAIVPGKPAQSELLNRVTSRDEDERMPLEGEPLNPQEIEVLRQWIQDGATFEAHWAFVPPERHTLPEVKGSSWVRNPIDNFILHRLEQRGLQPAPPAGRAVLARRLYYDLTGLPPSVEELESFLGDTRPDAYKRLVDKLLDSSRYGEKWARHWLDVVRYAETNSFERDSPKPYAWKYRDYVIRSFNEDKPYDQFIREQLAGDELDEVTKESITATGYYRLGTWDDEPVDALQAHYDDLDNIVSTTGQAFLGLTVGCARCHDHKIDPIPQTDYYKFLAFFADVTPYAIPRNNDPKTHSLWDCSPEDAAKKRVALAQQTKIFGDQARKFEEQAIRKMSATDQNRSETEAREELLSEKIHEYMSAETFRTYSEIKTKLSKIQLQQEALPPADWVLSLAKCEPHPGTTHVMFRGNPHAPGEAVEPEFPELFGGATANIPMQDSNARTTGRRRVLATWIASPDNMLTGRVMANRVWQHHFGRGIVRTANNFGQLGTPPTHPQLLDWLTFYLIDHEWRLKPLHRLILLSNAYQMASAASPQGLASDPENNLFWRFDMRRLTAEEIRDSVLFVSGELNDTTYGPSIYPPLSREVLATQSKPGKDWHTSNRRDASRRSIYIHIKRSLIAPELSLFDFPETDTSCEARFNTTQAAQALNLLHGDFMQDQARYLAERVEREAGDDPWAQVNGALRLILLRDPDENTIKDSVKLLNTMQAEHGLNEHDALVQYCLMVYNLNEFVFLD